ncbi:hypothetical protein EO98_18440 [Methanosarcina sp. 2.H.T.1A.6]|uniref:hypothetical protein n=1 Tax=unclassified Methanosarcina TaxID=2644672 RepID=UPI000621A82F|nr:MULTISPECIES: hypothetical protein [unclassified Methanosarcina]KKG17068.1 hypothetical protein EO94_18455 [Methanosarcina sp. 2.H.T.1A.3]KKG20309.1 hypothetical protein EO98_18440 [Methanosarcina sp. 2.H.T.1A.6]KKG21134.1 hypothetical protein EO97_00705 [Methanosarcina sp. 2.H.T.1A.15]KKG23427.1 hypothetical protein EO96_17420 [Methanosarcina sp. 2.H.T.1A.8]
MVKIQSAKKGQYRIGIPKEIIELTGWDENTELHFIPFLVNPLDPITPDTPILIKKISKVGISGDEQHENNST